MRPLLGIETSGTGGGVAILLPDGSVLERDLSTAETKRSTARPTGRGRMLVPAISQAVESAGLTAKDLKAIAVSVGPGSYTGLRIGVTAAKTLAWALSCDIVGVSTLEALAHDAAPGLSEATKRIVPVLDARRGEVYAAFFELVDGEPKRVIEDAAMRPTDFGELLRDGDHVFGPGVGAYESIGLPEGASGADTPATPTAKTVALLGELKLRRGASVNAHDLAPEYLRHERTEFKKVKGA